MSKTEEIKILKEIIKDILWMAIRYAHGRHTYAPSIIRDTVKKLKQLYPNETFLKKDRTIESPTEKELKEPLAFKDDYLDDLVAGQFIDDV